MPSLDDLDDAALLAAVSRGDHRALAALYDRHAPSVLAVALRATGDRTRAEDLLHDVFVELVHHARTGASPRVLRWLVLRVLARVP